MFVSRSKPTIKNILQTPTLVLWGNAVCDKKIIFPVIERNVSCLQKGFAHYPDCCSK